MAETLYLFRHCAVDPRLRVIGRGSLDYPLSSEGEKMSLEIVQFLYDKQIQRVITTGRRRTDIVGIELAKKGTEHVIEKRFQELHIPPVKSWEKIQQEFPEIAIAYCQDIDALAFPVGETPMQVRNRVVQGWLDLQRQQIGRIAIIGHDTSNQWLLAHLKNNGVSQLLPQALGGMYEIQFFNGIAKFSQENVLIMGT